MRIIARTPVWCTAALLVAGAAWAAAPQGTQTKKQQQPPAPSQGQRDEQEGAESDRDARVLIPWEEGDGEQQATEMPRFPEFPRFGASGGDDLDGRRLEEWQQEMQEWQRQFDAWLEQSLATAPRQGSTFWAQPMQIDPDWWRAFREQQGQGQDPAGEARTSQHFRKLEMKIDEDGKVRARVEREVDGERHEETYEADSIEEFRRAHPDVAREFGAFQFRAHPFTAPFVTPFGQFQGAPQGRFVVPPRGRRQQAPDHRAAEPIPEGPKLGVHIAEIGSDDPLRVHLGLEDGAGVLVRDVVEDSLASRLGIEPNDVLVRLGDRDVANAADIRAALADVEGHEDTLSAMVLRKGKWMTLEGTM